MRIILEKGFKVGIFNKKIDGLVDFSGEKKSFSYNSRGVFSKIRELRIDGQIMVFSEGQIGVFKERERKYSFHIKNTIIEGLTLKSLSDNVTLTARGVLISHPNKELISDLIFRTNGSTKGEIAYKCVMDKNNLFVFYTKIHKSYSSVNPDKFKVPWQLILFFIMSMASNTGGYNKS